MKKVFSFVSIFFISCFIFAEEFKFLKTSNGKFWVEIDELYEYDSTGNLIKKTDEYGKIHLYKYDANGKLTYEKSKDTEYFNTFDESGKLIKTIVSGPSHDTKIQYDYDEENFLIYEKHIEKNRIGSPYELWYEYDINNNVVRKIEYIYDWQNKEKIAGKNEYKYEYNQKKEIISEHYITAKWEAHYLYEYTVDGFLDVKISTDSITRYFYDYEIINKKKVPVARYKHIEKK